MLLQYNVGNGIMYVCMYVHNDACMYVCVYVYVYVSVRMGRDFPHPSRPALRPNQPPLQ